MTGGTASDMTGGTAEANGRPFPTTAGPAGVRAHLLRLQRRHALAVIVVPTLALAALLAWRPEVTAFRIALFGAFYALSLLGITVGFHRLLTHGAFRARPLVRGVLAALGCLAVEGPPIVWVANHRLHHHFSDKPGDPHSPHRFGRRPMGRLRSFVHAHVGWMLTEPPADILRYAPDLLRDPIVVRVNRRYLSIVAAGLVVPALIGWAALGGWLGLVDGLLWGGLVRIFAVQHVTWCINSVCHVVGGRPYATRDESRNNALLGLLALGEGWHNNHHAAPASAAHGLAWWQVDVSYVVVRLLAACGLATEVRVADRRQLAARSALREAVRAGAAGAGASDLGEAGER
jgi:stearoyl-CoA desaturase (delta-9 desaturase)